MAEVMIQDLSAPASYKQRLGIGMAMVATAFPHGLTEDEARGFSTGYSVMRRATASKPWPTSTSCSQPTSRHLNAKEKPRASGAT